MSARHPSRLPVILALAAPAALAAVPAAAQAPAPAPTITAIAVGQVKVEPSDRTSNDAIAKAVKAAVERATPKAIAAGRERGAELAAAAGLTLGRLVSVADTPSTPFGPFYGPYGQQGTFGPGRYCGNVPRFKLKRNAQGRVVSRKRVGTRRTCRIPASVSASVTMTFEAS
jgi:uncharacterized protein YggE